MRINRRWYAFLALSLFFGAGSLQAQDLSCVVMGDAEGRSSPLQELRFEIDGGEALLCYGAPSARGREIMGGLVPFGQPWRTGANEPTTLHLSAMLMVGGVHLEPGSYSMYMIPGEDEWEVIFNTNYQRWGIPINDEVRSTEVGSFMTTPQMIDEAYETLSFAHMEGHLMMTWENTHLHMPIGNH